MGAESVFYGVAAEQVAQKFKGATKITLSGLK
jgi:hypothetical protein